MLSGDTLLILSQKLAESVPHGLDPTWLPVAYEPVCTTGTWRTLWADDIEKVHADLRLRLCAQWGGRSDQIRIIYGGSVNPANAGNILAIGNVDGALVGGASLKSQVR